MKRANIDSVDNGPDSSKRCYTNIDELKTWMILDVVPGGLQGKDAGRDQTPILHLACIVGSIETGKELARKSIFIRPISFLRQQSVTSSAATLQYLMTLNKTNDKEESKENPEAENSQQAILSVPIVALEESGLALKYTETSELLDLVKEFSTFQESLQEIITFVERIMTENNEETLPLLITESHTSIRNVFHREIMHRYINGQLQKNLAKYPMWFRYLDIGTIAYRAKRPPTNHEVPQDIEAAASLMGVELENDHKTEYSRSEAMLKILQASLIKKVSLSSPHMIDEKYVPKVLSSSTYVSPDCVIEIRQVPWTATPIILANFFAGLNICPGGVAILLSEGRRSNTAYILFTDAIMARLALSRHQHQLPSSVLMNKIECGPNSTNKCTEAIDELMHAQVQRITTLQVFPGSSKDFLNCSICDIPEVKDFLNQLVIGEQVVVRIRGLPYSTTKERVVTFFKEVNAELLNGSDKSIFLVTYPDKRPTGDAFVLFNDEQMANKALTRHKNYVGERYVELFKASPSEMIQVCYNVSRSHSLPGKAPQYLQNQIIQNSNALQQFYQSSGQLKQNLIIQPNGSLDPKLFPNLMQSANQNFLLNGMNSLSDVNFNQPLMMNGFPVAMANTTTQDLTDPTDPNCPFARPLPQNGTSAMMQISNLPYDTSRHIVRLFLGPANFAKIYRMKRIEHDMTTGSKWLLSLENSTEAVNLIKDLVDKTFPAHSMVVPIFGLYGVAFDGQLYPINLTEYQVEIPANRICAMSGGSAMNMPNDNQLQQLIHTSLFSNPQFKYQVPDNPKSFLDMSVIGQQAFMPKTNQPCGNTADSSSLYISGLPSNVTSHELTGIFQDISSILISQPKFIQVQNNNDQCTYYATFSSPLEVQLCLSLNGSPRTFLRNGHYTAILTPSNNQTTLMTQNPGFDQLSMISNISSLTAQNLQTEAQNPSILPTL